MKKYSLTEEEKQVLLTKRNVFLALESWQDLLMYLRKLVDNDSQDYTNKVIKKRLGFKKKDIIEIDMNSGEVHVPDNQQ